MVFLFKLFYPKIGRTPLHPETTFVKVLISSFTFSIVSFPLLCLLCAFCIILPPWIKASRSKKEAPIPLERRHPDSEASRDNCPQHPLINITLTTQTSLTNLPPPLSEQNPSCLRTVYESRLKDITGPFVFVAASEAFEKVESSDLFELVEVPPPFELSEVVVDESYPEDISF